MTVHINNFLKFNAGLACWRRKIFKLTVSRNDLAMEFNFGYLWEITLTLKEL